MLSRDIGMIHRVDLRNGIATLESVSRGIPGLAAKLDRGHTKRV